MSRADLALIEGLVKWVMRSYAGHPDEEDLRQVARIAAWRHLEKKRREGSRCAASTVVVNAARWAIGKFIEREGDPSFRSHGARRQGRLEFLSLDAITQGSDEHSDRELDERSVLTQPDFAPALTEAMDREQIVDEALAYCTPVQREALVECYLKGKGASQFARERGSSLTTVQQLLTYGLNHYRRRHQIPCRGKRGGSW